MSNTPPQTVLIEFLQLLNKTVGEFEERLIPVARGSVLLRHWYGARARPAADIDLECFHGPDRRPEEERTSDYHEGGYGNWGEFVSLVDFGKAMCRYAAGMSSSQIQFRPIDPPSDGSSLWEYGTPGERYYAGWRTASANGQLQIDIAEPGNYDIDDIDTTVMKSEAGEDSALIRTYTPECMLAAKLMWVLRGLKRQTSDEGSRRPPIWSGKAKDLFDIHLLLTSAEMNGAGFRQSMTAFCSDDNINWSSLLALMDVLNDSVRTMDFPGWNEFVVEHPELTLEHPLDLLRTVAARLQPLLGDFHNPDEIGFLEAVGQDIADESAYQIYADYLEEQNDSRCEFLRAYSILFFHKHGLDSGKLAEKQTELLQLLQEAPGTWLMRLWGTTAQSREMLQRIASAKL